jgi:hypothetical protein
MKYISFSLWGDKPIYNIGAIRNAELAKNIYPEWKVVIYYDNSVPSETIDLLKNLDVQLIDMSTETVSGPFWRFLASEINDCEFVVFRDTDSRISIREKMAVDEWILSGKSLHIMRDHPYHYIPAGNNEMGILAGMWGIKGNIIKIREMLNNFNLSNSYNYGYDQTFLKQIYLYFQNDKITHDEFFEKKQFPIKRENQRFIGERIDQHDNPLTDDYKLLIN